MFATFIDELENADAFGLEFEQLPATLGRGDDATVPLIDRWISRAHCEISVEGPGLYVRDLGSRNGTFVNGERISEAILAPGDVLHIGVHAFRVSYAKSELAEAFAVR